MGITPLEFAQQFLYPYTVKGNEIVPVVCPFCHGGSHRDKHTFALNTEKQTYNCKRGSCGVQGHFTQLCKEFGIRTESEWNRPRHVYKPPGQKPKPVHEAAQKYLQLRGISKETAGAYRVGTDEKGNLMFPYYTDTGEHVFNKFRYPRKLRKGERKAWREADTMPVLFGMHLCDASVPLTIFEGEFDAMSGSESGLPNCVSVPSGAEDFTWLDTCWDFLQRFDCIYLYGDNDSAGCAMIQRLAAKLSDKRVFVVRHECKDANELLYRKGRDAVRDAWSHASEIPVSGLINLAEVVPLDVSKTERIRTGIGPLNQLLGGFVYGDVTVWTGRRGEGKSTMLSQVCLDAVDDGKRVCAYSGELRADRFQYWADLQAAGVPYITEYYDHAADRQTYYVKQDVRQRIHDWYSGKFWLYDNDNVDDSSRESADIIRTFELAAKRYDCRLFMVDNLMTADDRNNSKENYYQQQSQFVGKLVKFAKKYNVHVHLVAHPKKTSESLDNDSISGSADITNRVANSISLTRLSDEKKAAAGCDVSMKILKNRWEGQLGTVGLNYDKVSRRLYVPSDGNTFQYGWEFDHWEEVEQGEDMPF